MLRIRVSTICILLLLVVSLQQRVTGTVVGQLRAVIIFLTLLLMAQSLFAAAGLNLDRVPYFEWAYNGWRILQRNQNEHVNSDVHVLGRPAHHIDVRRLKADPLLVDGLTTREATYVRISQWSERVSCEYGGCDAFVVVENNLRSRKGYTSKGMMIRTAR